MSSQQRRSSASPSSTLDSLTTQPIENRAPWNSPLLKPIPKKLDKQFKNALEIQAQHQGNFFGEVDEDQAFERYTHDWAREDKEIHFKQDLIEDLEEAMEATMDVADKIVKLVSKLKRELRKNK